MPLLRISRVGNNPHTLFECEAFEEEREAFLARFYSVCPLARQLTDEYRCRLVMGDKLPREIENPLYRYLIAISKDGGHTVVHIAAPGAFRPAPPGFPGLWQAGATLALQLFITLSHKGT